MSNMHGSFRERTMEPANQRLVNKRKGGPEILLRAVYPKVGCGAAKACRARPRRRRFGTAPRFRPEAAAEGTTEASDGRKEWANGTNNPIDGITSSASNFGANKQSVRGVYGILDTGPESRIPIGPLALRIEFLEPTGIKCTNLLRT